MTSISIQVTPAKPAIKKKKMTKKKPNGTQNVTSTDDDGDEEDIPRTVNEEVEAEPEQVDDSLHHLP